MAVESFMESTLKMKFNDGGSYTIGQVNDNAVSEDLMSLVNSINEIQSEIYTKVEKTRVTKYYSA